jgi:hypothetical protein
MQVIARERCGRAVGSALGRSPRPEGVGVEPQNIGDDREQRRRVEGKIDRTLNLRQDVTFQKAVQQPAQLGASDSATGTSSRNLATSAANASSPRPGER